MKFLGVRSSYFQPKRRWHCKSWTAYQCELNISVSPGQENCKYELQTITNFIILVSTTYILTWMHSFALDQTRACHRYMSRVRCNAQLTCSSLKEFAIWFWLKRVAMTATCISPERPQWAWYVVMFFDLSWPTACPDDSNCSANKIPRSVCNECNVLPVSAHRVFLVYEFGPRPDDVCMSI